MIGKEGITWNEQVVSDLYHAVAQPLTALRCALDLALRQPLDASGYRKAIRTAIAAHERAVQAIAETRQIAAAAVPGAHATLDFAVVLHEVLDDFEPVAHNYGSVFSRRIAPHVEISSHPGKLRQLLFMLLNELIHRGEAGEIEIDCRPSDSSQILLEITLPAKQMELLRSGAGNHMNSQRHRQS